MIDEASRNIVYHAKWPCLGLREADVGGIGHSGSSTGANETVVVVDILNVNLVFREIGEVLWSDILDEDDLPFYDSFLGDWNALVRGVFLGISVGESCLDGQSARR